MGRERIQTRADGDTIEQIEDFREDHDVSQSEAVRRLIRRGLETEGYRNQGDEIPDGYAKARINQTVRHTGGVLIALMLAFLVLAEVGAI